MVTWDEVRRLIVRHVAPVVQPLGFSPPGRRMCRSRGPFVDVIRFDCHRWGDRVSIAFGCGVRAFSGPSPEPWTCAFQLQHFAAWPQDELLFRDSVDDQVAALERFAPRFADEVERWFGMLSDPRAARRAADRNDSDGPSSVGLFDVPSPAYDEVVRQLQATMDPQ